MHESYADPIDGFLEKKVCAMALTSMLARSYANNPSLTPLGPHWAAGRIDVPPPEFSPPSMPPNSLSILKARIWLFLERRDCCALA